MTFIKLNQRIKNLASSAKRKREALYIAANTYLQHTAPQPKGDTMMLSLWVRRDIP